MCLNLYTRYPQKCGLQIIICVKILFSQKILHIGNYVVYQALVNVHFLMFSLYLYFINLQL